MTPSHQTPPTLTVYVPVKDSNFGIWKWDNRRGMWKSNDVMVKKKSIPDPSYINAIINDASSSEDKIQRLQKYMATFDNLTKY